ASAGGLRPLDLAGEFRLAFEVDEGRGPAGAVLARRQHGKAPIPLGAAIAHGGVADLHAGERPLDLRVERRAAGADDELWRALVGKREQLPHVHVAGEGEIEAVGQLAAPGAQRLLERAVEREISPDAPDRAVADEHAAGRRL